MAKPLTLSGTEPRFVSSVSSIPYPVLAKGDAVAELSAKEGDKVLYTPDLCHWNDSDYRGERVFAFAFEAGPPLRSTGKKPEKGQPVTDFVEVGAFQRFDADKGVIHTASEHVLRPVGAKAPWPAEVAATGDGLALRVTHPNGFVTLYYPLEGERPVTHDVEGKKPHSYRLAAEGGE